MTMIKISHLRKEYPKAIPLQDVTVDIEKGDVISIIGPSGTGKSTLVRCINMLDAPTSGQVFIDGEEITAPGCDITRIRRKMGMVFQNFNLFSHLTAIENVMAAPVDVLGMSRQEAYDKGMSLLRAIGLADKALSYPDSLSGGQQQRIAIARALAIDPEIILFDEPVSALDPAMIGEVKRVIMGLRERGMTMLVVTHDMKFARDVANRVFYMDEGGIYEDGPPEQVFDNPLKEKTRQFVRRLKVLEYPITSKNFDFLGFNSQLEDFGIKHAVSPKTIYNLQGYFEEMCTQIILPALEEPFKVLVTVEYSEEREEVTMSLRFDGPAFNPLETDNELSLLLAKRAAKELAYDAVEDDELCNVVTATVG